MPEHNEHLTRRPRRLRQSEAIRNLVRETELQPRQLILPMFVVEGNSVREEIASMPGVFRLSIDELLKDVERALTLGVRTIALFPKVPDQLKTNDGTEAVNEDNLLCQAVRTIKKHAPEVCIVTDIALDPYSAAGHDGIVAAEGTNAGEILNDETVDVLARMAVVHAQAGADMVAPSDMMDGRVGAIRRSLDRGGFKNTAIMSYTAKYASAFYGPFRDALDSAPADLPHVPADKKTYQMDAANAREALVEATLDSAEGADIVMVKPAGPYLDVISKVRAHTNLPVAAYQVSGEYAMLKAAHEKGWLDYNQTMPESLTAIARAGADIVLTYAALDYAAWWREINGF